ncbi:hypothetical protein [Asaia sp. VD9]|uniref:hypothetical protein n=1 Tax=Asaia sp. VD9 TaxID=3081235 RepID=UPI0030194776
MTELSVLSPPVAAAPDGAGEVGSIAPYSLYAYFRLRLRYLLHAGKTLLMQRWLALLAIILLSPSLPIVALLLRAAHFMVFMLAPPTTRFDAFSGAIGPHVGAIIFAQTGYLLWAEGLRAVLRGGAFRGYLDSLPISLNIRLFITAGLLCLLDLPLLVPLPVGLALVGTGVSLAALLYIMRALVFAGLTILLQAARIEAAPLLIPFILIADLALALDCGMGTSGAALPVLALPVLCGGAGLLLGTRHEGWSGLRRHSARAALPRAGTLGLVTPVLRLQIRCCVERGNATPIIMLLVWVLPFALWALLRGFDYDSRSVPVQIVVMGLIAQSCLVPLASLAEAHERAAGFCRALPLSRFFWVGRDIGLVLALFTIPALLCLLPLAVHRLMTPGVALGVLASYLLLLSALRLTVSIDPRWRPMPAIALSAFWVTVILWKVPA